MKKKELLFNYFLQKCVQKEQELLSTDDFKTAMLAIILSRASMVRRIAESVTMGNIYFCEPLYAQELFIYLCFNAEENGDKLKCNFNFSTDAISGKNRVKRCEDRELTAHINKIFPHYKSVKDIDCACYQKLTEKESHKDLMDLFFNLSNLRDVSVNYLEIPADRCEEMDMIDRAWHRLEANKDFINMLHLSYKHDQYGCSRVASSYQDKL